MPTATCALALPAAKTKSPSRTTYFMYLILDLRVGPAIPLPAPLPTSNLPRKYSFDALKQSMPFNYCKEAAKGKRSEG